MKAIFALLIGVIIGALAQSAAAPDPLKLQIYTAQISYLAASAAAADHYGTPEQSQFMNEVVCGSYRDSHLEVYPRNYLPGRHYQALKTLCQTQ